MKKEIMIDDLELFNEVLKDIYKSYKKEINNLEIENHNKKKIDILINKRKFVKDIIKNLPIVNKIPECVTKLLNDKYEHNIYYHQDLNVYTISFSSTHYIRLEMRDKRYLRILLISEMNMTPTTIIKSFDHFEKEEDFKNSLLKNENDFLLNQLYEESIIYDIDTLNLDNDYLLRVIEELKDYIY
jgi:hypothetical protein